MKRHSALLGMVILLSGALATGPYVTAAIVPSLLLKLSTLKGRDVQDTKGAKIGDIEDVVIDAASGQIAYAVLSFGGLPRVGRTLGSDAVARAANDESWSNVHAEPERRTA